MTRTEMLQQGTKMILQLDRMPKVSDFGTPWPAWRTIYKEFGGLKNFQSALRMHKRSFALRKTMIHAGIHLGLKFGRQIAPEDFVEDNFPKDSPWRRITVDRIAKEFGSWEDYIKRAGALNFFPTVHLRDTMITVDELIDIVNRKMRHLKPMLREDVNRLSTRRGPQILPLGRKAGRCALYSKGLAQVLVRIRHLQSLGLNMTAIKKFMSIGGMYDKKKLTQLTCSTCDKGVPGFVTERIRIECEECIGGAYGTRNDTGKATAAREPLQAEGA